MRNKYCSSPMMHGATSEAILRTRKPKREVCKVNGLMMFSKLVQLCLFPAQTVYVRLVVFNSVGDIGT